MQAFNSPHNFGTNREDFSATGGGVSLRDTRLSASTRPALVPLPAAGAANTSNTANARWRDRVSSANLDSGRHLKEIQQARADALAAIEENELSREIQSARKMLDCLTSLSPQRKELLDRIENLRFQLQTDRPASYTKTIKLVSRYAALEEHRITLIGETPETTALAKLAVAQVEEMMERLPHSFKGKVEDIPEKTEPGQSPHRRLIELRRHLEDKARSLDETRNSSLHSMASAHPILKEIVNRLEKGQLPEDGTLIIFSSKGHYLAPQGSMSPHFIEVSRLKSGGVGADGGGFNRFSQHLEDICGAIVMRPLFDEHGKRVEVPGKSQNGKPVFRKTVEETIGDIPAAICKGLDFVQILRRFKPPQ